MRRNMDEAAKAANLGEPRSAATVFEDIVDLHGYHQCEAD